MCQEQARDEAESRASQEELQKQWRVEALESLQGSDGLAGTIVQAEFAVRRAALLGDALELQHAQEQLDEARSQGEQTRSKGNMSRKEFRCSVSEHSVSEHSVSEHSGQHIICICM